MNFLTLKDMDLEGKKVIVRVDYNVPLKDGEVKDDSRIKASLPTIKYLLDKKCKLVVMSHLGRPYKNIKKGEPFEDVKKKFTMLPVAKKLQDLLGKEVTFFGDYMESEAPDDDVVLFENLRLYLEEKNNDEGFARRLSTFGDVYVNDAFGNCHREQASMTCIPKFIPGCVGLLVEEEIKKLSVLLNPEKPFVAIIGGAKADKIGVIKSLLPKVDSMIIGGVLANTFLKAKGVDIKGSKFDEESLTLAKDFIDDNKILLPTDVIAADKFDESAEVKNVPLEDVPDGWLIVDIGKETLKDYKEKLKEAKTILWGGPLGVFEIDKFANGTKEIAEFISGLDAVTIIGGGDSAAAVYKFGYGDKMTHVSTGGGASLEFIEKDGKLPAITALEEAKK